MAVLPNLSLLISLYRDCEYGTKRENISHSQEEFVEENWSFIRLCLFRIVIIDDKNSGIHRTAIRSVLSQNHERPKDRKSGYELNLKICVFNTLWEAKTFGLARERCF